MAKPLPTVPDAVVNVSGLTFRFQRQDTRAIQAALPVPLNRSTLLALRDACRRYIVAREMLIGSPSVADARASSDRILSAVEGLLAIKRSMHPADRYAWSKAIAGTINVDQNAFGWGLSQLRKSVREHLGALNDPSNEILFKMQKDPFRELIHSLATTYKRLGFNVTVAKNVRAGYAKASGFTEFCWAVVGSLPADLREHTHSVGAFSKALNDALKGWDE